MCPSLSYSIPHNPNIGMVSRHELIYPYNAPVKQRNASKPIQKGREDAEMCKV